MSENVIQEKSIEIERDKNENTIEVKEVTRTYVTPSGFKGKLMSKNRVRFRYRDPENNQVKYFYFDNSITPYEEMMKKADEIISKNKNETETKKRLEKLKLMEAQGPKPVEPVKTRTEIKRMEIDLPTITLNQILKGDITSDAKKKSGSSILFLASSKGGKSTLMAEALRKLSNKLKTEVDEKPITIVMSNTLGLDKGLYKTLSNETIFSEFSPEMIQEAAEIQKKTDRKYPVIVSLDDIIDQKNDMLIKKLFTTFRNLNIFSLMAIQSCSLFNKSNRGQVNHLFIGRLNNAEIATDAIEKFILGSYNEKQGTYIKGATNDLVEWLNKETRDHNFIYINMLTNKIYKLKKAD
jgi:hypothetical protein